MRDQRPAASFPRVLVRAVARRLLLVSTRRFQPMRGLPVVAVTCFLLLAAHIAAAPRPKIAPPRYTIQALRAFPGTGEFDSSEAVAINNQGAIVGTTDRKQIPHAVL